jgi:transposase InsO family protein
VGRWQAGTLMKKANVEVKQKKRFRVTTDSKRNYPVAPNLLDRQFDIEAPNRVWGGDISYLWTDEGWLYLAVIIDLNRPGSPVNPGRFNLFSRRVVGWSLSKRMKTTGVIMAALVRPV